MKVKKPGIYYAQRKCGSPMASDHLVKIEGFSCDYAYAWVDGSWSFYETDGLSANGFDQLVYFLLPLPPET